MNININTAFFRIKNFILHRLQSRGLKGFGIHSPFIFHLVTYIIADKNPFYCFAHIEKQRKQLLKNQSIISVTDYGTGCNCIGVQQKKVSKIAVTSLKPARHAQCFFRLINYFNSKNILEIGTSLGITTAYMAKVSSKARVISLDGCPNISAIARQTLKNLYIDNAIIITGNFSDTLPRACSELLGIDFLFIDGNHTYNATIEYFSTCLPYLHNQSVVVIDDIYYNKSMYRAWLSIINHNGVRLSLDLFYFGIIFFNNNLSRQHFKIRY